MTQGIQDLIIVGSGPAGYTAAIYAARAGLSPTVLMGELDAGGALMTTTQVENYPGFSVGVEGPVLMEEMRTQAERFGAELLPESAATLELTSDVKTVTDSSGRTLRARSVILAMGSAYRRLGLSGEERLSGRGVSWCATCDGYPYRDKRVLVVGGGDSALEEALFLMRIGADVQLLHRGTALRASKIMQDRALGDAGLSVQWATEIAEIHGTDSFGGVTLRTRGSEETRFAEAEGLFIAIGHEPRSELVRGQLATDRDGYVIVESPSTTTSLAGVFACGDLSDRRYRQAVTAAGTGCAAALDAERYLSEPTARAEFAPQISGARS